MSSFLKYLLHRPTWQKLPPLPRMYSVDYDVRDVDNDTSTLMRMTHTRCPQGVEILKKRYGMKTAKLLIAQLPARKRPRRIGRRIGSLVRTALGLLPYDPARTLYRQHLSETRRR